MGWFLLPYGLRYCFMLFPFLNMVFIYVCDWFYRYRS